MLLPRQGFPWHQILNSQTLNASADSYHGARFRRAYAAGPKGQGLDVAGPGAMGKFRGLGVRGFRGVQGLEV